MSEVVLDCDELFPEREALERALGELASADAPLCFEVLFVTEEEIRALNVRERNVDAVTDVLSFPASDFGCGEEIFAEEFGECLDEEGRILAGSVVVCTARAEEQAKEFGHSVRREICYLIVHGVLHCLGYDHMMEADQRKMREKEEYVMEKIHLGRDA